MGFLIPSFRKRHYLDCPTGLKTMPSQQGSARCINGLVLVTMLFTFSGIAQGEQDDSDLAGRLRASGEIQSLETLILQAQRIRPGTLLDARLRYEAEHQGYVYEIQMLDRAGQVWELEFDARTGALVEQGLEYD